MNIYLVGVRMINCQTHSDTVYEFSPDKLNVIVAPNATGKSVLIKMLKATVTPNEYNNSTRKNLIRHEIGRAHV